MCILLLEGVQHRKLSPPQQHAHCGVAGKSGGPGPHRTRWVVAAGAVWQGGFHSCSQWRGLIIPHPELCPLATDHSPCMLKSRDRKIILRLAREKANIQYNGVRVSFHPEFSAGVQRKRSKFQDVKKRLLRLQLPYAMLYPARLGITARGKTPFFDSASDAATWLDHNEYSLRNCH